MSAPSSPQTAVVWFRRDLRLHDHPALADALARADRVAPLFVLDPALITGRWSSPNRTWFMLATLAELAASLEAVGSVLVVRAGRPELVVPAFAAEVGATAVHVSRDYAPYGRARDGRVAAALLRAGVVLHAAPGNLIHEPEDLATQTGTPYRVFGPFHRAWSNLPIRMPLAAPPVIPTDPALPRVASTAATADGRMRAWVDALGDLGVGASDVAGLARPTANPELVPDPGESAARLRLERWTRPTDDRPPQVLDYQRDRDLLAIDGTSRMSQDLRWGLLARRGRDARPLGGIGTGSPPLHHGARLARLLRARPVARPGIGPPGDEAGLRSGPVARRRGGGRGLEERANRLPGR